MKTMKQKQKIEYIRIALTLMGYPVNNMYCELICEAIKLVERKKGNADLQDASKLSVTIQEKYKSEHPIFPDRLIKEYGQAAKTRAEHLGVIKELTELLINNRSLSDRARKEILISIKKYTES